MTITFELKNKEKVDDFLSYMKEVYDYISIPSENIPATISIVDNTITVFMTDEFFEYTYGFFIGQLLMALSGNSGDEKYLELIADYYRKGMEELMMHNIQFYK